MGGSSKKTTVGYKYYLGMHMVLCHGPVDYLRKIEVDDRRLWSGVTPAGQLSISKENLFGGEKREGGISGTLDYEDGSPTQTANSYLQARLGSSIPAYRGVVGVVLRQMYLGMNPYLKRWAFKLQRVHVRQDGIDQWYDSKAAIGQLSAVALYFALDFSGSMHDNGGTRLALEKAAMIEVLDYIDALISSGFDERIDIMLVAWGSYPDTRTSILRRSVDSSDITALKSWVNSTNNQYETYFPSAVVDAPSFFSGAGSLKRVMLFITDGEPGSFSEPDRQQIVDDALAITDGISNLSIYGINISLTDTSYTGQMDNTPDDGVPIVSETDSGELVNAVLGAITGHIDMNPAHIIRECLTDPDWGMGYAEADIDDTSFTAAADTLHGEVMGMSLLWDRQTSIESFIGEVVKHIDAALYVDRSSGKFVLKLIRDDYNAASLTVLDESNIDKLENLQRPSFGELTNSVTVNYWDASTEENASVTVQDGALVQMQNAVINTTVQYPGFTNATLASRVAMRDLLTLSSPLWTCTVYTGQVAKDFTVGSVFKLSWDEYGISEVIMRVTGIAYGDGKSNQIRIQATQDVFAIRASAQVSAPDPDDGWTPIDSSAAESPARIVDEMPYYELVTELGQTEIDANLTDNPDLGYLIAAAGRPEGEGALNALVLVDAGAGYEDSDTLDFCPYAYLDGAITTKTQTVVPIRDGSDLDLVEVGQHAQINDELVRVDAVSASSVTLGRAILDSLPETHADGDLIVFWDNFPASDEVEYVSSESVNVKILTVTGSATLEEVDATAGSVTFGSRAVRPYPPANLQINSEYFPENINGNLSLSWAHRDRTQQTSGTFADWADGNIGPETDVTYTLRLYNEDDTLVRTVTGLTGTTYEWTDEGTDSGHAGDRLNNNIRFELESVRDGYTSLRKYDEFLYRAGYGVGYGYYFGGLSDAPAILAFDHPNLLAAYTMDNISGSTLVDESPNGEDGTITGATTTTGQIGNALNFDGSGDYVDTTITLPASGPFSISQWVRFPGSGANSTWMSNNSSQGDGRCGLVMLSTGRVRFFLGGTPSNLVLDSTSTVGSSNYAHVVFVREANDDFKVYFNNVLENTINFTGSVDGAVFDLGRNPPGTQLYVGDLDMLRVFDKALTTDEIDDLYNES